MTPIIPIPLQTDAVARKIVNAAYHAHRRLGPGLLESVYESCLIHELKKAGLRVERQVPVPVIYDNIRIAEGLRLDLLVENCVVVELKTVELLLRVHTAQLLSYLKLTGHRLGLLINFNVSLIKRGIKRIAL